MSVVEHLPSDLLMQRNVAYYARLLPGSSLTLSLNLSLNLAVLVLVCGMGSEHKFDS
jgi:hypothetical protein